MKRHKNKASWSLIPGVGDHGYAIGVAINATMPRADGSVGTKLNICVC